MTINIFQTAAIIKRIVSNARHGVGDGDGGQTSATRERPFSNARHGVGDGVGSLFSFRIFNQFCL